MRWAVIFFSRGTFPTLESNLGLLHGWQILYRLSYQGCHHRIPEIVDEHWLQLSYQLHQLLTKELACPIVA